MKRFHARGRGRASRVEKWFSHITIVVRQKDAEPRRQPAPRRRRPEPKQEAA
jgi:large subunit ribosomal protein L22